MSFYNFATTTVRTSRSCLFRDSRPSFLKLRLPHVVPHQRCNVATDSQTNDFDTKSGPKSNSGFPNRTIETTAENDEVLGGTGYSLSRATPFPNVSHIEIALHYLKPDIKKQILSDNINSKEHFPEDINDNLKKRADLNQGIQDIISNSSTDKGLENTFENLFALGRLENVSNTGRVEDPETMNITYPSAEGHKFGLPELPIPSDGNLKYRDDPIVQQVTNLLMKDGKKSVAQRNMSFILNALRTAPPPKFHPTRLLIPGHPPAHHLPLDPVGYLTLAIDSIAPLLRIRSERGAAGGGAALQIPVPLGKRQRRRQAVMWILDSANKKPNRSSGRGTFAQRFADEIISVVEGRSPTWDKRLIVHKAGTTARNNVNFRRRR
ncbi:37S ribosomal protein S7, mitochondrial [Golovinomyces cichoracearum]|uniref:Small ribosomal subunit protein uS7m n=1 Tax=Golovinomyces cichoracearum TaxID=62708 RepID=A0A420HPU7_9PEZI|nr:37S ribosomal protein S7, mitochondrial [Golovinomyces cichoracearum]